VADGLADAKRLTPYGVDIRYAGDFPETLPGDEIRALRLAQGERDAALSHACACGTGSPAQATSLPHKER
jgi:hypothetical protein